MSQYYIITIVVEHFMLATTTCDRKRTKIVLQ